MATFRLVDEYLLSRLGVHGTARLPHRTTVRTTRRTTREPSYGFVHVAWLVALEGGARIASLPPDIDEETVERIEYLMGHDIADPQTISRLRPLLDAYSGKTYAKPIDMVLTDTMYACNANTLAKGSAGPTAVRLRDARIVPADGLSLPTHCFPGGIVYGVIVDCTVASVAYAHRTGEYHDIVADVGVETAPMWRRRGYARACVRAVADHVIRNSGEAIYKCSPTNAASIATARSAGFIPYGKSLVFAVR